MKLKLSIISILFLGAVVFANAGSNGLIINQEPQKKEVKKCCPGSEVNKSCLNAKADSVAVKSCTGEKQDGKSGCKQGESAGCKNSAQGTTSSCCKSKEGAASTKSSCCKEQASSSATGKKK